MNIYSSLVIACCDKISLIRSLTLRVEMRAQEYPYEPTYRYMLSEKHGWIFVAQQVTASVKRENDASLGKVVGDNIFKRIEEWQCNDGNIYIVYRVAHTPEGVRRLLTTDGLICPDLYVVDTVDVLSGIAHTVVTIRPCPNGIVATSGRIETLPIDTHQHQKFSDLRMPILSAIRGFPRIVALINAVSRDEEYEKDYQYD